MSGNSVIVSEAGNGPYAEFVIAGRHIIAADEPQSVGGRDSGMSPYEFLMAGLGTCTAMTLRMYATRNRWPVDKITVKISHEKVTAADGTSKIDRFERTVQLNGKLTEEQRTRLMAVSERCPVSQTLQRPSIVVSQLSDASEGLRVGDVALSAA